jgi:hypothetical protein
MRSKGHFSGASSPTIILPQLRKITLILLFLKTIPSSILAVI